MNKFFKVFLFLVAFFTLQNITAQVAKPVQFNFSAIREDKGDAYLIIKASINSGAQLFSAIKKTPDDPFISSIVFDTSVTKYIRDSIVEIGNLKTLNDSTTGGIEARYFTDSVVWKQKLNVLSNDSAVIKGSVAYLAKVGDAFENGEESFGVQVESLEAVKLQTINANKKEETLLSVFLLCLVAGLLAVLTPCVFPLVPVTVSFFLKRSKSRLEGLRNATWYSLSIILIYTIPTIVLVMIFGDTILYKISTHPISNLLFFVIFIIFAISFFGAFEISLPNSWANKADEKAGKGGLAGIFFMALTLVIVSFSCTGPIVGTLLGETSTKGVSFAPVIGMFGFGLGLALPFSLFAFFPSMLGSLPKSGGWLNTVKVTFGFIELALALKFLSNVDLSYHWRLLDREIFLILWIVIFALLGFYLLGKLKFSHDSDLPYISVPRLFLAIASFTFALYLFPGLWGAPLKAIGGWLPHQSTQDFNLHDLKYQIEDLKKNGGGHTSNNSSNAAMPPQKHTDILHVPYGLTAYFDLDEGIAAAKALNKPIMLDFTGHTCANCREMEAEVWADPEVLNLLKNDFVLISLYVDETRDLPFAEQYTNAKGEKITTVGGKNLDYEVTKFGLNAQPLYMFLDHNQQPLSNEQVGYVTKKKFLAHLHNVKAEFEKRRKS
ncbi:MAG: cytochrome c-type biosis protein DsbD, protein-disulfide reductase [Segetibacter sp.]|nr:cytochrome c-type biosis protein DsbD, protein-disulfide reductase [Segetibacter sp.]